MKKLLLILVLGSACSGGPSTSPTGELPAGSADQPDIVLVSIDTLRADHLSAYGHSRPTSPFIDSLAAQGVRFDQARSASPWTLPAHTTMLSGQLPATHKVVEDSLSLDPRVPVLPELLQAAGYATAAAVATLYVSELYGFDRGFDHFQDFDLHTEKANLSGGVVAQDVVDEALQWWEGQEAGKPVFLFLHVYDVHYEYDPPEPYASMFDRPPAKGDRAYKTYFHFKKKPLGKEQLEHQKAQYDESIRYVDAQLERLQAAATAAGRKVRWVVTSDHGEEFGERGSWGHAHTLYAEQLHIPLVVSGPGVPQGKVVSEVVGNHDIAPTIASWVGSSALQADGMDLNPAMAGAAVVPERPLLAETSRFKTNRVSLFHQGLRLEWDLKANSKELYDTRADPKEVVDLARDRPEDVARLAAETVSLLGSPWTATASGEVKPDNGVVLYEGQRKARMTVEGGTRFQVLPYNVPVDFERAGAPAERFAQVGKQAPRPGEGATLTLVTGGGEAGGVELDDAQRAMLEAIGYIQDDSEEGEEGQEEASGDKASP